MNKHVLLHCIVFCGKYTSPSHNCHTNLKLFLLLNKNVTAIKCFIDISVTFEKSQLHTSKRKMLQVVERKAFQ